MTLRLPRSGVRGTIFRFAILLALLVCSNVQQAIAGQAANADAWLQKGKIGITSPLADCSTELGCFAGVETYPLLYVQVVSSRVLMVGLADQGWIESTPIQAPLSIQTTTEGGSEVASRIQIERNGFARTTVGFDPDHNALNEHRLYLELASPMQAGTRYRLNWPEGIEYEGPELAFQPSQVGPALQVNQVGYWPSMSKVGRVGLWLGTLGPLVPTARSFQVIDASGQTVFEDSLELTNEVDEWSGHRLAYADFSSLRESGTYQLAVEGLGRSAPFSIGTSVYKPVFHHVGRLFYYRRNSTPIVPPWSEPRFARPGGIPEELSGRVHPAATRSPLANGERAETYRAVRRGWFDAGDYGQYVVNAAPVWYTFSLGFDLVPAALANETLNLPESQNGVPDLLDELEWGMDWLLGMQDPADGGVYFRLTPTRWDDSLPHQAKTPRYLFEKTSHATASFAAAAAIHARLLKSFRPERSARVLKAAETAWRFLERHAQWPAEGERYQNPKGVSAGAYPDTSATDNRFWAAAELFRSTSDPRYLESALAFGSEVKIDNTRGVNFSAQGLAAYWSLLMSWSENPAQPGCHKARSEIEMEWCEKIRRTFIGGADWRLGVAQKNPWNAPLHPHKPYLGWGTFGRSSKDVLPLLQAWRLSGESRYLAAALECLHPQLGANPQSISYITGVGQRWPRFPLSKLSQYDEIDDPLPGIPVHGPHFRLPSYWPATRAIQEAYFPPAEATSPGFPALQRYVDSDLVPPMSEPTVAEVAIVATAFGLVADESLIIATVEANPDE